MTKASDEFVKRLKMQIKNNALQGRGKKLSKKGEKRGGCKDCNYCPNCIRKK